MPTRIETIDHFTSTRSRSELDRPKLQKRATLFGKADKGFSQPRAQLSTPVTKVLYDMSGHILES